MDFSLDPTIVQAAHDERVRQAERAYLALEARRGVGAANGANWPLRLWRRWRGRRDRGSGIGDQGLSVDRTV